MLHNIPIKDLMSTSLTTVRPLDVMMVVSEIFDANDFHHIPVIEEDGQLAGMISKHDYNKMLTTMSIFKTKWAEIDNQRFKKSILVKDVMTESLVKLRPEDKLLKAVSIFKENIFHALPVVDENNRLVGIVTTYDLLNYAFSENKVLGTT